MSLIEPVLAEPATPDDFARQAAERVTPFAEYAGAKLMGGIEALRPVEGAALASLPSRYAADEYGLMPPGPPPADLLTKDQFDAGPHKRPGLEWEPGETEARAAARAAVHDRNAYRDSLVERSDTGWLGQAAGFGLGLGAAALDPTNYIPLLGPASKAAMLARFGRVGGSLLMHGSAAALNTGLFEPLAVETARVQGRDYGWEEAGADILTNAMGGAVLGTAVGEGLRYFGFGHEPALPKPGDGLGNVPSTPVETPPILTGEPGRAAGDLQMTPEMAVPSEAGAGVVPRRPGQPAVRVDDMMRRADAASLALDQLDRGEPVDVGKLLANDPAVRAPAPAEVLSPAAVGDAGKGIVGGMYDMLHERYSRGETTEAGAPSLFLQVAKAIDDGGRPLTRDEFPALAADVMTARKAGTGPEFQAAMRGVIDKWAGSAPPTRGPMSLATAPPEPPHPSVAEAAARVGKGTPDLETFAKDARLEGYDQPLPGHEQGGGRWRELRPGEGVTPGGRARMNLASGRSEVLIGPDGRVEMRDGTPGPAPRRSVRPDVRGLADVIDEHVTAPAPSPEEMAAVAGRYADAIERLAKPVKLRDLAVEPGGLRNFVLMGDGEVREVPGGHVTLVEDAMRAGGLDTAGDHAGTALMEAMAAEARVVHFRLTGDHGGGLGGGVDIFTDLTPRQESVVKRLHQMTAEGGLSISAWTRDLPGHEPEPGTAETETAKAGKAERPPTPAEKAAALAALPPELQDIEALRRAGDLPEGADAILADAEREAQTREAWGDAYGILLGCVARSV